MKTQKIFIIGLSWMCFLGSILPMALCKVFAATSAKTLEECFQSALQKSEVIGSQKELLIQAREKYWLALSTALPQINGIGSYLWQESSATTDNTGTVSSSPSRQPLAKIQATQPLFHGFKEFIGLRGANKTVQGAQEDYNQSVLDLYKQVAAAYYSVLSLEQDDHNLATELKLYDNRTKDLKARTRIGRSRSSEVLSVESAMASVRANQENTRGQILAMRESLAFLTGFSSEVELQDSSQPFAAEKIGSVDSYLTAVKSRPDYRSQYAKWKVADDSVWIAWTGHIPYLDFTGDYYLKRTGPSKDIHWDAQIILTVPLFSGGQTQSNIRTAQSQLRQAQLSLLQTERAAVQEIRTLYIQLKSSAQQETALAEATQLAEKSYKEQTHQYNLGLVTNLDVLNSLSSFQDSQTAWDRAKFSVKLNKVKLDLATSSKWSDRGPS